MTQVGYVVEEKDLETETQVEKKNSLLRELGEKLIRNISPQPNYPLIKCVFQRFPGGVGYFSGC